MTAEMKIILKQIRKKIKRWETAYFILLIFGFTFFTYFSLWSIFFQQDEWSGFGKVLYAQKYGYATLIRLSGSHFTPLSAALLAVLYNLFELNHLGYAWFGIIMHAVNSILVYFLARLILNDKKSAMLAAILFVCAGTPAQAVTWYAASMSFLPSAFFSLISLILFELYIKRKRTKFLVFSLLCLVLALGFRENAIFILGYFVMRAFILKHKTFYILALACAATGLLYLFFRILPLFFVYQQGSAQTFQVWQLILPVLRIPSLLFVSLPQVIVPRDTAIEIGQFLLRQNGYFYQLVNRLFNLPVFIETVFVPVFYSSLWFFSAITLFLIGKSGIAVNKRNIIWLLVLSLFLSVLPFLFLPSSLFMESRHFYLSVIGFSILLSNVLFILFNKFSMLGKLVIFVFCVFYIGINVFIIQRGISMLSKVSTQRQLIVKQFNSLYPKLPLKTIFYAQGDPLPFQSGVGYMLMVLFQNRQEYEIYLNENFLWDLGSQGYKQTSQAGFGYFTDIGLFRNSYCENRLTPENIFSFYWSEKQKKLLDTTGQTRIIIYCQQTSAK